MDREVFLDTSFAVAITCENDAHHVTAIALAEEVDRTSTRLITTRGVLLELGNVLARAPYRQHASELLAYFENDSALTIVEIDKHLYVDGLQLYQSHKDKTWGLVDCISFTVMRHRSIHQALTADRHFVQAGFEALLLKQRVGDPSPLPDLVVAKAYRRRRERMGR